MFIRVNRDSYGSGNLGAPPSDFKKGGLPVGEDNATLLRRRMGMRKQVHAFVEGVFEPRFYASAWCRYHVDRARPSIDSAAGDSATDACSSVCDQAVQIHGGYGYVRDSLVERLYRDAPLLCIGEGTNELQRIIIARQLVERNPI